MDYRDILKKKMYAAVMREKCDIEFHFGNICKMMPKDIPEDERLQMAKDIWDGAYRKDIELLDGLLKHINNFLKKDGSA